MAVRAPLLLVLLLGVTLLPMLFFPGAEAGEVGVCWGTIADNLPEPSLVVQKLLKPNSITMVRIYDTNSSLINALANTGIKLMVALPNEQLTAGVASTASSALQWVQDNVAKYYPTTLINGIAVGNEVFDSASNLNGQLVPAMRNVQAALATLGLDGAIKVSTPVAFDALGVSWEPSQAAFLDDVVPVIRDLVAFLRSTGAPFLINVYPFRAYLDDPQKISVAYWTFQPNDGAVDRFTGRRYYSLYDAQMDALRYAIGRVSPSGAAAVRASLAQGSGGTGGDDILLTSSEVGCSNWRTPHCKEFTNGLIAYTLGAASSSRSSKTKYAAAAAATSLVGGGAAGTSAYIFALFNEDNKADETERNFGLFYPNMQPVYEVDFHGGGGAPTPPPAGGTSWCVANAAAGDAALQAALDWACGHGADCGAIQPGARCFSPDTKVAHATYAFNDYYQRNGRAASACDFNGAGSVVYQQPNICDPNQASWCVANAAAGDAALQAALDWACGHGADCGAIQPGARCFSPDTKVAHATYAFNDYYQRKGRAASACNFNGAGSVVNQQPNICDPNQASWCVANAAAGDARLQAALDWACGHGADCSAIQRGGRCFNPDTKVSHASYAFNDYYQRNGRAASACSFNGAGSVVYQAPKIGNCQLQSKA
ncbi:unnamed protein product [Urochloa humidicola]